MQLPLKLNFSTGHNKRDLLFCNYGQQSNSKGFKKNKKGGEGKFGSKLHDFQNCYINVCDLR